VAIVLLRATKRKSEGRDHRIRIIGSRIAIAVKKTAVVGNHECMLYKKCMLVLF
jgi:hypothetical protein